MPRGVATPAEAPRLVAVFASLAAATRALAFAPPVAHVYRPLDYAWPVAAEYARRFGDAPKEVVLVGMNPGPFGMGQTGVPFGEVRTVRDWMGLTGAIVAPREGTHPARPVLGFACTRSEVSGARLWGAVAKRHPDPRTFFARAFVLNYCPLLFLDEGGRNLTPDKLRAEERARLERVCDEHLRDALGALGARVVVGVGQYAAKRVAGVTGAPAVCLPPPSPASPQANRGWDAPARAALEAAGVHGLM